MKSHRVLQEALELAYKLIDDPETGEKPLSAISIEVSKLALLLEHSDYREITD